MKTIQILGPGCAKCTRLAEATQTAAAASGVEFTIEKVTDLRKIMGFGVMQTPALVVDGVVKTSGRVPSVDEIKRLIS